MAKGAGEKCNVKLDSKIVALNTQGEGGKEAVAVTEYGETIITADNVVISCGPWTNSVPVSANFPQLNLEVWHVQWATIQSRQRSCPLDSPGILFSQRIRH